MKFRTVAGRLLSGPVAIGGWMWDYALPKGLYFWGRIGIGDWTGWCLWVLIPYDCGYGCHSWHCLPVAKAGGARPDPELRASWEWDGDGERPTLAPSIACGPPDERDWHGFMRAGVLKACE